MVGLPRGQEGTHMRLHGCFIIVSGIRVRHCIVILDVDCVPDWVVVMIDGMVGVVTVVTDLGTTTASRYWFGLRFRVASDA